VRTVRVLGASLAGAEAELVTVEGRFEARPKERTEVSITGLPDTVIREGKGRLLSALQANALHVPPGRLFLNLVPAARRKAGETLDLPLVLAAAAACGHLEARALRAKLFLGEVGLDGELHAVPGGLAAALAARERGVVQLVAPPATAREAAWIPGVTALAAERLEQVVSHLCPGGHALPAAEPSMSPGSSASGTGADALDEVRGQASAKLALAAAAAGGHGLLLIGPPGAGKSMLARRLGTLLPEPTLAERLEITRVLSATGRWPGGLARDRPFRAPHHTVSYAGLVGGGSPPAAGEITLAHGGVLFLDELPEFRREALEALRQPLESGRVLISRAGRRLELPARFQLVAAMNPCPCGYQGHPRVPCRCPPAFVERYLRRISGPLLDRIELRVEVAPPTLDELSPQDGAADPSPRGRELRIQVERAASLARDRQGERTNAELDAAELDHYAPLEARGRTLLERAARARGLSARALSALRRVARTLADLEATPRVTADHLARALALRAWSR
jgi:magnesium chelatase family protein